MTAWESRHTSRRVLPSCQLLSWPAWLSCCRCTNVHTQKVNNLALLFSCQLVNHKLPVIQVHLGYCINAQCDELLRVIRFASIVDLAELAGCILALAIQSSLIFVPTDVSVSRATCQSLQLLVCGHACACIDHEHLQLCTIGHLRNLCVCPHCTADRLLDLQTQIAKHMCEVSRSRQELSALVTT